MALPHRRAFEDRKVRRHHRVVELVRQQIVEILSREVKDPRLGHFTVTDVELSPDLSSALVYVCRFVTGDQPHEPTEEEKETLLRALSSASHFIYERLKKRLVMKHIPSIRFTYDWRLSKASEVWGLVKKATSSEENPEV